MLLLPVQPDLSHAPTAGRPVHPPVTTDDERSEHDRGSWRSLQAVGPVAVLGAMIEQRKRSSSPPPPPEFQKIP